MTNLVRSLDRGRVLASLRRVHPVTGLWFSALGAGPVYSLAKLTRFPLLYGDESWNGSAAWSFGSGHGLRPWIGVGGGVYDNGALAFWLPRLGTAPFVVADF